MTQKLQTTDGQLAYDVYGESGTPVVAIPGLGDTRATWRVLGPMLAEAGYRVFAMDLRGHGDSDAAFGSYTPEDIGDDAVALIEALDLKDVVLMGNSIGGAAVAHAALAIPDRVSRLVMFNPFVRDMPADRFMRPMVPLLFAWPWGTWAWGMYRSTLFKTVPTDQSENQASVLANLAEPGRMAAVRGMLRASKSGVTARLADLRTPSLVLMGSEDPDYTDPAAEGETLKGLLGGPVEVAMIERTGHYPQIERPDESSRQVLAWLGGDVGA